MTRRTFSDVAAARAIAACAIASMACSSARCGDARSGDDAATSSATAAPARESDGGGAAADARGDGGAAGIAARGPWNVVLVSVDSLRADMPWAGYPRPIAPRLTALQATSVSYTRAYSVSSFTSKSVPAMLTGRYPSELQRTNKFFTKYLDKDEFACTAFDAQGIPCIGAHAHGYFGEHHPGFESGFREWRIVPGITFDLQKDPYVTSDKLTPIAISLLADAGKTGKPFFAWFHYMDPHDEYQTHPESPHYGQRSRDKYDEEVFFTDLWIGKLLDFVDAQPWAARTVVVLTSDHGEAFGEHLITRHAHELYEVLVHVPLFFRVPGVAPRVIDVPRSHVDLVPTFAELLGAKALPSLPGRSLASELAGGDAPRRDVVMDLPEDDLNYRRRALLHDDLKIIAFGNDESFALYDLASDPDEKHDLMHVRKELAADMRRRYREASSAIHDVLPKGGIVKYDGG